MSVNRCALTTGSGSRIFRAILDVFNWTSYSSLQKWAIVAFATFAVSWQFSLWILMPLFLAVSAAGVKLSEEILQNKKASHVAELLFFKLESAYIEIKNCAVNFSGNPSVKEDTSLPTHIIPELSSVQEIEWERSSDFSIPVKLSAAMRMELNSIQLLIIRDFVRSWYADFSYDPQFLKETKYYLQQAFYNLVQHIAQQDPQLLLTKIIHLYHFHFAVYQKAINTFESHKVHPKTKVLQDHRFKRHSSVDEAFENITKVHPAIESESAELNYLKGVVSMIVLSSCSSHVVEGPCIKTLLIQILTNKVMFPVMKMMSNPDWLMEVIIILTSDEKVSGNNVTDPNVESGNEKDETAVNNDSSKIIAGQSSSDRVDLDRHKHMKSNGLAKLTLQPETEDLQVPVILEECDRSVCGDDVCLLSKHDSPSLSSLEYKAVDPRQSQSEMQQSSVSNIVLQDPPTTISPSIIFSETHDHFDDIRNDEEDQLLSKEIFTIKNSGNLKKESLHSLSEEKDKSVKDEPHADTLYDDNFTFESDPQKIMSYGQKLPPSLVDSSTCSDTGHSTETNSLTSESSSETVSSSVSKFSSIKSFFVDSLKTSGKQQSIKKPRSLSLFSEKLVSNLNPLTHKKRLKAESNIQQPPQLLVDGVPFDNQSVKMEDSHISSIDKITADQPTPTYSDLDMTPSPGFFSSVNSFFSLSSSQNDMNKLCENDGHKVSPSSTSSPTGQIEFVIGAIAVTKDSSDLRPFELDDRRIFQDVTIPETSVSNEFRSSSQYSLYNIEYEALYFTEEGKAVIRSGNVKRRYREFLSLQSRLESHSGYKKYLKNMKVPKRWPTIPFKSIDKETVASRRLLLEKYLKDLIEIEAICNGPDLREFLAYEGDSHIAFVKKSPDITVPRFDKMFMRGVSEVVDRIKALPNIPQEVMSGLRGRETPDDKQGRSRNHFDADTIDVNIAYQMDMISETSNILPMSCLQVLQDLDTEDDKDLIHNVITDPRNIEQTNEAYNQEVEKVLATLPQVQSDGTASDKAADGSVSLSLAVLDLLVQGCQNNDHWICRERVVKAMHSVLGKALNRYLENSISSLTTEPKLVSYLKMLREKLWPQGQLWMDSAAPKTEDQKAATREQAKRCLINFFPVSLRLVIGDKEFEEMITEFLSSLQSEKMNRHILYLILDMLVEQLFPEIRSHDLLHSLLFSRSRSAQSP